MWYESDCTSGTPENRGGKRGKDNKEEKNKKRIFKKSV